MEAVAGRVKTDSKQRFEVVERQLRLYVDEAVATIRTQLDESMKKANNAETRLSFIVGQQSKLENRVDEVEND